MITERLQKAMERAAQLPPEEQDKLAVQLESAVANALWDAQLNDPRYDHIIEELIADAKAQEPLPFPKPRNWTEADENDDTSQE